MAVDLTTVYPDAQWYTRTITLAATWTKVTLPAWQDVVRITVPTDTATENVNDLDVQVGHDGTDGGAVGSHYTWAFKGGTLPIFRPKVATTVEGKKKATGEWSIYLAGNAVLVCLDPVQDYR